MTMEITFLWWADCPSHAEAWERLGRVLEDAQVAADVQRIEITTDDAAERWSFPGSPTILVNGRDIDPRAGGQPSRLTCRLYFTADERPTPLPPEAMIRAAVLAANRTSHDKGETDAGNRAAST
jgi:hypothetical protein